MHLSMANKQPFIPLKDVMQSMIFLVIQEMNNLLNDSFLDIYMNYIPFLMVNIK